MPAQGQRLFPWMMDDYAPERVLMKARSEGLTWEETAQALEWRFGVRPTVNSCRQKAMEIKRRDPDCQQERVKVLVAMHEKWAELIEEHLDDPEVLLTIAEMIRENRATIGRRGRVPQKRD